MDAMHRPSRRWFSFGLRTMFVVVTVFGVWLSWELQIVRERKGLLAELEQIARSEYIAYLPLEGLEDHPKRKSFIGTSDREYARISRIRRLLGDQTCIRLAFAPTIDASLIERIETAFPEAELQVYAPRGAFRDSICKPADKRQPNTGTIFKTGLIEE